MFRDTYGAALLGIKTVFMDSNQGAKSFENVAPDYRVQQFKDVLKGIAALENAGV